MNKYNLLIKISNQILEMLKNKGLQKEICKRFSMKTKEKKGSKVKIVMKAKKKSLKVYSNQIGKASAKNQRMLQSKI